MHTVHSTWTRPVVHLSRDKLITRFDDRYAVANFFLSPEFGAKLQREVPLFLKTPEFSYFIT